MKTPALRFGKRGLQLLPGLINACLSLPGAKDAHSNRGQPSSAVDAGVIPEICQRDHSLAAGVESVLPESLLHPDAQKFP